MRNYILIEVDTKDATFALKDSNYEIYYLPMERIENIIKNASTDTVVEAQNQAGAFKIFNSSLGIFKRANKNYYEKCLLFEV